MRLDEIIEEAKRLEEIGRKMALERERAISDLDTEWLWSVIDTADEMKRVLYSMDLEEAFKVIAFATSMDFRLLEPRKWYGPNHEKLEGECRIEDPVEMEVCAVNKLLKKLEERLEEAK